jgi:hypothetical protein
MATFKHFSGTTELKSIWPMRNAEFAAAFPGVKGVRQDSFSKLVGRAPTGEVLPVERTISYKSAPSLHVCNAKCLGGKVNGSCECQCGGKNHGLGMFTSLMAA